jgi:hypothetical protein
LVALAAAQVRDPLPVPDVPGYRTLKCDFHSHTVFSDGDVWPTMRISEAWRDGLDVLALSDHADYNPHKQDVQADLARPYALARGLAEQLGLILIPAIELGEGDTHCNVLFVTDYNALRGLKLLEALRQARAQDAFVFWNHPGWKQKAEWFPIIAGAYDEKLIQGVELVNGSTFYAEAFPWIEEKSLTILSNSDVHRLTTTRSRAITLVFARTADTAGVREALFARRTAAWMGGEVWGGEQHLKGLWEGALKVETPVLTRRQGASSFTLRLRNLSAIPFRFRLRQGPPWLRSGGAELRAESVVATQVSFAKDAPERASFELELEITNLHTAPEKNLMVRLPLRLESTP